MMNRSILVIVVTLLLGTVDSQAAIHYTLSGTLPTGSTNHSQVSDGESWTATFLIDETTPAGVPDFTNASSYFDAVISGSLVFSGGYVAPFDFSDGYDVVVFNEATNSVDALFIRQFAANSGIRFQAITTDDAFTSTALPLPGASITPNPATLGNPFVQLSTYSDANGTISYNTPMANNVSFTATAAVPEPGTVLVWGGLGLCSSLAVRRRSRAT